MKVTQVSLLPTEEARAAGRPALTPELLAASGARYSRSNEGLDSILARIDPEHLDRSVDSIFRMIDYGHQSIADMAPAALFIDDISIWLAYLVWSFCPTAGGQESSTRYIRFTEDSLIQPEDAGIADAGPWRASMAGTFAAFREALALWEELVAQDPCLARIPGELLQSGTDKAAKQVARMRRNYAFDRARYFLPAACRTNLMLVMSGRAWAHLARILCSHPAPEAVTLGEKICGELRFAVPRLLGHAGPAESTRAALRDELEFAAAAAGVASFTTEPPFESAPTPFLEVMAPPDLNSISAAQDMAHHENRYAWFGPRLRRTAVRFGWEAVSFAEIRDLNRHRTGTKTCTLQPLGFYAALDQLPESAHEQRDQLTALARRGAALSRQALERMATGEVEYVYHTLLGTQYRFEHVTTADKFLYEAELRTGTGAHYRYARHLREALALWYNLYPSTRGLVLEGSAEPE